MPCTQMPMLENQSPTMALDFALSRCGNAGRMQMLEEHLEQWVRCGYTGWIAHLKSAQLFRAGLDGVLGLQAQLGRLPEKLGREMARCFLQHLIIHPERMELGMMEQLRHSFYPLDEPALPHKRAMAGVLVDSLRYDCSPHLLACQPHELPVEAVTAWLGYALFTWCHIHDLGSPGGQGIKLDPLEDLIDGLLARAAPAIDPPWAPENWWQRLVAAPAQAGAMFSQRLLQCQTVPVARQPPPRRV